jgi:hypothetical protein
MTKITGAIAAMAFALSTATALAGTDNEMFILHDLAKNPDDVAADIRDYVDQNDDWLFLAQFGLKGGEVLALKICYLPLGEHIFAAGVHVSAMMPCGHLAFYEEDGQARLSMLNLEFMTTLNPDPNLERAVEIGAPAFAAMLEELLD